jgi:hypothetical protein
LTRKIISASPFFVQFIYFSLLNRLSFLASGFPDGIENDPEARALYIKEEKKRLADAIIVSVGELDDAMNIAFITFSFPL